MSKARSARRSDCRVRRAAVAMAALAAFGVSTSARGSNFYWAGDNASNGTVWNATTGLGGTNWSSSPDFNSPTAGLPGSADDVFFYLQPVNLSNSLGQDFTIKSLTFLGGTSVSPNSDVTIGGANTLTLNAGGISVQQFSGTQTLNANVTLGAAQTWSNNGANALVLNGIVSGAAGSNLTLAGTGTITFSAANTYAGTINLSTNGVTLNLNGSGSILNSTALTLNGGSVLNLDNTATNNTNRVANTAGIASSGGTVNLKGSAATETLGTMNLTTGTTRIIVDAGSVLTLGGLTKSTGGAINFSSTGTTNLPSISNTNGIIGGHATIGNIGSVQQDANGGTNVLDFAAVDGSKNVIALATYALNDFSAATNNTKVDGSTGVINLTTASTTVNSLYLTGTARVAFNGSATNTLIIGTGGVISNAATQTIGGQGPQIDIVNAAVLGNGIISANGAEGAAVQGRITSATGDLVVTTASNLRINALITDNGATPVSLTKNGSGTLDLSDGNGQSAPNTDNNTYTGITTINGGLVTINADLNLGAVPAANTANNLTLNGGELRMTRTITLNARRGVTVGPQGGTLSYNGGNTTHLTGFLVTGTGSIQYSCIPGFGNVSANQCAMDIGFTTTNYQGATTFFTQGSTNTNAVVAVIYFTGNDKVPDTSAVTVTTVAGSGGSRGILNLFGKSDTWGSLAGGGDILNGVATTSNLTVGGNNLSTTYSGSLGKTGVTWAVGANSTTGADNSTGSTAAITLTKVGSGIMTMSGANGYTGATSINGGMLNVTGSLANTPVTVGNGTLSGTLGGTGTIGGNVLVTSTGHLSPSSSSTTTSTLTLSSNLTINGGATFDFNFGAAGNPGTSDTIMVGGTTTLNAGTDFLNITALPGFGIGTYNLITSTGTLTNNVLPQNFTINASNKFNYAIGQSGNNLVLTVTQGNPILTWIGSVNGNWVVGGPTNWNDGSSAVAFANTNNVVFDDNGIARNTVTVDAAGVTANAIDISNTAGTYTIGGGAVAVTTAITKTQAGSVVFNSNVSSPLATITTGTITVGAGGVLNSSTLKVDPAGALVVASGGSLGNNTTGLTLNGAATLNNASQTIKNLGDTSNATTGLLTLNGTALTISGTSAYDGRITGTGSLAVTGSTTLSNGTNSYSGGTTVTGTGQLSVTNSTGSATGSAPVTVGTAGGPTPGPTLSGNGIISGPITIHSNATLAGTGIFGSSVTLNGTLSPGGAATVASVTLGALTSTGGATLNYDLGAIGPGTTSDTANVNGTVNLSGAQTVSVNQLAGFSTGTYTLLTATGIITNGATFTVTGVTLPRSTASVSRPTPNTLVLNVTAGVLLNWTGAISNVWDIDNAPTTPGTANWTDGNPTPTFTTYVDGSPVTFPDGPPATNTDPITIPQNVSPGAMTFTNTTATPYTIGVAGDLGVITGSAGVVKSGNGLVTFAGANTYTGGVTINGGTVRLTHSHGAGNGPITVNPTGTLALGTATLPDTGTLAATSPISLAGGTVGVTGGVTNWTVVGDVTAAASTTTTMSLSDVATGTGRVGDIIITGVLSGSGNLTIQDADLAAGASPDSNAVRLRGTGTSTYTGTITLSGKAKFELQTAVTGAFSPAGTGKLVMTAGTINGTNGGSFSIMNLRNTSAGDSTFGNDLTVVDPATPTAGNNVVVLNLLGAGPGIAMGKLTLGSGQGVAAGATTGNPSHLLSFSSVSLGGGNATFFPGIPNNTTYVVSHDISVGAITETTAGSGIIVNGLGNMILRAANSYTGNTTVQAGSLIAAVAGALPVTTNLTVNGGTVDVNSATLGSASQTVASLAGAGGAVTNSDASNTRILTVTGNSATPVAGAITGNLALTKSGTGVLNLSGTNTYTGPTTVTGGTLRVNGALGSATAVVVQAGRLDGNGDGVTSGSIAGTVTIGNGVLTSGSRDATLAPGNSVGTIGTGALAFAADGIYAVEVDSTALTADKTITTGVVTINPAAALSLADLGGTVLPLGTKFNIIQNGSASGVTGTFAGLAEGGTIESGLNTYRISYVDNADAGAVANDVTLTTTVPEPACVGLLGLAAAAGLLSRRRRR
jgi:autotransporter-associated beta strand protein